jgi:hypothetical protein
MHFPTSDVSEYYRWRTHRVPGMGERKVIALLPGYDGRSFQTPAFQLLVWNGMDWHATPTARLA